MTQDTWFETRTAWHRLRMSFYNLKLAKAENRVLEIKLKMLTLDPEYIPAEAYHAASLEHAFLSGVVAARNIPQHEEICGPDLWKDYKPYIQKE
jgi:hypothetical protein